MRMLVTGAAGFIGRVVSARLGGDVGGDEIVATSTQRKTSPT